ncbi:MULTISPECIES: glycosyltransferase family 4 protein [Pseudoalteromonas]|uniref:Glycosyl transferase family 1 n=1 Tax=Pseudoalteromonas amylolytica TaxID=1859457 RepID=A0A1S1N272_9GAMM|nr:MULTISPECIES: glycosyltransferase family 4 protein [Pseudoalteromonas]OHU90675.1 glycosyl transferase family 1 [Pseudoalteromonas sp. JW3]OHU92704.1 glycosyl transferase family 1 [Pseudoalteromonas amylolytica]
MSKIIVLGALPSSLVNFRGELLKSLVEAGHEVIGMASGATEQEIEQLKLMKVRYVNYDVQRNGLNPISDFKTLWQLRAIFKREKPDIILAYTIKPVIWGGIAAKRLTGCRFYALITGLGFAFQRGGLKRNILVSLVVKLYRNALSKASGVIFQNSDNRVVFIDMGICPQEKTYQVNGSGVKLEHFKPAKLPDKPVFLLIARLLGDKGIREYAEAAMAVKRKHPHAIFQLVGPEDPSPDGIKMSEVDSWQQQGAIQYLGATTDVRPFIKNCSIFVLPSYHEGMPRTVLEAMAMSRPILTTDVPGCRNTVIEGVNGFLVEKGNVEQLADKLNWYIENQPRWGEMAQASYKIAVEKFDVKKVNTELMSILLGRGYE